MTTPLEAAMIPAIGVYAEHVRVGESVSTASVSTDAGFVFRRVVRVARYSYLDQPMVSLTFSDGSEWAGSIHRLLYKAAP